MAGASAAGVSAPTVTAVAQESPADKAGIRVGDLLVSVNGREPRDVIEYQQLTDEPDLQLLLRRGDRAVDRRVHIRKDAGQPLGIGVSSAVFDRVRTCDNHCAFCFIHQLPKGMRKSLYMKDDDYRLSFLYGNFTTLTRFTELDVERVLDEGLGPLFVSIHATDPAVRAAMLRNPRGATSLRWLQVLLDAGIEVHGQVVVCPGVNDGAVLEQTLADVADRYSALASVGVVPLGISRHSREPTMRAHTVAEARAVCTLVEEWQAICTSLLGRRMVFAADEYHILAGNGFPSADAYEGYPQHENGIGMVRSFEDAFCGKGAPAGVRPGFFAWVDGAPAAGYRALRTHAELPGPSRSRQHAGSAGTTVLTGRYGASILRPLLARHGFDDVEVLEIENRFFGGNIAVAGLLTGEDVSSALEGRSGKGRYLLPDACLSEGRFLDGVAVEELPCAVQVVASDGASLRAALVDAS